MPVTDQDAFILNQLKDIHEPLQPQWWPPAPGWWIAFFLVLILLFFLIRFLWKQTQHFLWQSRITRQIKFIVKQEKLIDQITTLSMLLRRVALHRYPAEEVASLYGEAWLDFLDNTGGNGNFKAYGQLLGGDLYKPLENTSPLPSNDPLFSTAQEWIRRNT